MRKFPTGSGNVHISWNSGFE